VHDGGGGGGGGGDFGGGSSGGHHGGDFGGHHGGGHNRHDVGGAGDTPYLGDFARHPGPRGRRGRAPLRTRRVFRLVLWAIIIGVMIWTFVH
jgi:hypothetical protein